MTMIEKVCSDCPLVGYPTDATRCAACPRRSPKGERLMNSQDTERIYQAALRQAREQKSDDHQEQADQLLREALSLFLDPESIIDLRDWVRSAQQHLGVDRAGSRLFD